MKIETLHIAPNRGKAVVMDTLAGTVRMAYAGLVLTVYMPCGTVVGAGSATLTYREISALRAHAKEALRPCLA